MSDFLSGILSEFPMFSYTFRLRTAFINIFFSRNFFVNLPNSLITRHIPRGLGRSESETRRIQWQREDQTKRHTYLGYYLAKHLGELGKPGVRGGNALLPLSRRRALGSAPVPPVGNDSLSRPGGFFDKQHGNLLKAVASG